MTKLKSALRSFLLLIALANCSDDDDTSATNASEYKGTASVTKGRATTTTTNLFTQGARVTAVGSITATDNTTWTVPSEVNYAVSSFPFATDLYNPYGTKYTTSVLALAAFNSADIVTVDAAGDIITGYIFADNYFEMHVNGTPVAKDKVPYTDFNSHIVKFKVSKPYTIAFKLVDWEENLGLGSENNGGSPYYPGDGGLVAVFKDANGNTVAKTSSNWKAQTFYTAPIKDLSCPSESGTTRSSANCSTSAVTDGSMYYGLHWTLPANWMSKTFDDSSWPAASVFPNSTVGVDNKTSYTNFTNIFDDPNNDAVFIWSTNLILDNEVIVRYTVQ